MKKLCRFCLLAVLLLGLVVTSLAAGPDKEGPIVILHTNDVHAMYGGTTENGTACYAARCPGGAGGGVTIQPLGFLVVQGGHVTLLQMNENKTTADRVVSLMPELVDKLGALLKKEKDPPQDPQA